MRTPNGTAQRILKSLSSHPKWAVVLGSGFDGVRAAAQTEVEISYDRLPGFVATSVDGHPGKLVAGHLGEVPVLLLCGRGHYYEGHSMASVTFPIRVLAACGVTNLLLTNAAGGINAKYRPGDFMCLTDHLNWMGTNPLRGRALQGANRFVDLSQVYDRELVRLFRDAARSAGVRLHSGVYAAVPGPCYETPAEVRALQRLGADAVGMSTVPEAIVAKQCRLRVAGLSCITNRAAGLGLQPICHEEVLRVGEQRSEQAVRLVLSFLRLAAA